MLRNIQQTRINSAQQTQINICSGGAFLNVRLCRLVRLLKCSTSYLLSVFPTGKAVVLSTTTCFPDNHPLLAVQMFAVSERQHCKKRDSSISQQTLKGRGWGAGWSVGCQYWTQSHCVLYQYSMLVCLKPDHSLTLT